MKTLTLFLAMLATALGWLTPAAQAQTCAPPTNVSVSSLGSATGISTVVSFTPSATALSYTVRYYWIGDSTAAGIMSVNTTASPVVLPGLTAGAYYRVSVVSNCAGGFTTASSWVTFPAGNSNGSGSGSCAAPTNITATPLSTAPSSAIVVSFTPSPSAVSYTVHYRWIGDSTGATARTTTVTSSPATLSGLQYPAYYITVTSNCAGSATGGGTATSAPIRFQFPWASCGTPTNVRVVTTGATTTSGATAAVTFGGVSGATSYTVQCLLAGTTTIVSSQTISSTSATLNGLLPNTTYVVRVVANCAGSTASSAASASFTTPAGSSSCGNVTNLSITATSGVTATGTTSAVVSFTAVAGATSYTVQYYAVGDSTNVQTLNVAGSPVTLSGLLANTRYVVRVITNCAGGVVSTGVGSVVRTSSIPAPCGSVTNITVTATSASTATLSFTPGVGNTSFHIAYYASATDSTWISTNGSSVTLTGLIPGHTYTIRVISVCGTATSVTYNNAGAPVTFNFRGALASRTALGKGDISVFPNPAQRTTNIVLPAVSGVTQAQLTLLNSVGQSVRTLTVPLTKTSETRTQLDLGGIKAGLYTLRVQAGNQTAVQRLAVE
jgi:hypothetical protein